MESKLIGMDFEIDKTVGNEGEYGVKFNEPKTDFCQRCRKPIPIFEGLCNKCRCDADEELEAFQDAIQERGGIDG